MNTAAIPDTKHYLLVPTHYSIYNGCVIKGFIVFNAIVGALEAFTSVSQIPQTNQLHITPLESADILS